MMVMVGRKEVYDGDVWKEVDDVRRNGGVFGSARCKLKSLRREMKNIKAVEFMSCGKETLNRWGSKGKVSTLERTAFRRCVFIFLSDESASFLCFAYQFNRYDGCSTLARILSSLWK